jgi:hypothetical protein
MSVVAGAEMEYNRRKRKESIMQLDTRSWVGIVLAVGFLVGMVAVARGVNSAPAGGPGEIGACVAAQGFVGDTLRAPATASFASCTASQTQIAGGEHNVWTVTSHVDAQNTYGANVRNNYRAVVQYHPSRDSWSLIDLHLAP